MGLRSESNLDLEASKEASYFEVEQTQTQTIDSAVEPQTPHS